MGQDDTDTVFEGSAQTQGVAELLGVFRVDGLLHPGVGDEHQSQLRQLGVEPVATRRQRVDAHRIGKPLDGASSRGGRAL